jgi:hypothetical protein
MSPAELVPSIQRRPFVPFRIVTSDGTNYDIRHPEMAMLFPTAVLVAFPNEKAPGTFSRFVLVSMYHIVRVETLEAPSPAQAQGNNEA